MQLMTLSFCRLNKFIVDVSVRFTLQCYFEDCISSTLTSLERFMSLRTLITMVDSVSLGLDLLAAPRVRSTDRMFLSPKS